MNFKVLVCVLLLSTSAMAKTNCRLSSTVYTKGLRCEQYVTRFLVANEEECRELAESTRTNVFFGVTPPQSRVLKTKMTYRGENRVVREKFKFEKNCDDC